jgi:putative oxidoreductase
MDLFRRLVATNNTVSNLLLRLALGIVMFPHGSQKMLGWFGGYGFSNTMSAMSKNLPSALVFLVIIAEFFGSIALILGFLTRAGAFGIFTVMLGAVVMIHSKFGFFMNWAGAVADGRAAPEGFEYHLLAIGIALALMLRGGGAWSIDRLIAKTAHDSEATFPVRR